MLIVFQSPFADARDFVSTDTYHLKKPDWLNINPYLRTDFIHRFGVIEKVRHKKIDWTSSDIFCRAKKAFSFDTLDTENLSKDKHGMVIHSRRLFPTEIREIGKDDNGNIIPYQNKTIGSLEVGFIHSSSKKFKENPLSAAELNRIIFKCIDLNISVKLSGRKKEKCKLININRYIDNIYLHATTEKAKINSCCDWWVTSGAPMLVVNYSSSEVTEPPINSRLIKHIEEQDIRIFFGDLLYNKSYFLKTWYIESNKQTRQHDVKILIEGLMHLNTSQQCLNRILSNYDKINVIKGTPSHDKLQRYLEFTFASLFRRTRFGFPCKEFADILMECENSVSKTVREGMLAKFRELGIRGNYLSNLEKYITALGGKNEMNIDILILTAVKDEFDVVLGLETDWRFKKDNRGYNYYTREMTNSNGEKLTIALASAIDMGEVNAANLATRLSNELNPNCLAMVGICAGWRKKVNLGDVIVADKAFSYDNGKLISFENNEIEEDQLFNDIHTYNLNPVWKQNAQNITDEWQKTIKSSRPIEYEFQELWLLKSLDKFINGLGENPSSVNLRKEFCPDWTDVLKRLENKGFIRFDKNIELTENAKSFIAKDDFLFPDGHTIPSSSSVHVGAVATGKKVVEDRNIFPKISRNVRSVLGLEMEASAIGAVAELEQINKFVIVKAVSDYADEDKNDHFRSYSIEASYRFLTVSVK